MTLGNRLDRYLIKKGFLAQWPLLTLSLIEARRIAMAPGAYLGYRRAARAITAGSIWADFVSRDQGYRLFSPETFRELPQIVAACQAVFARHEAEVTDVNAYGKPYFFNILTVEDLRQHPVFVDFALSPAVTEAVTGYLGQIPRLNSVGVFYTAINETVDGSQMYHADGDALAQIKCFVNAWDVGPGSGAFTFLPKPDTSRVLRSGGLLKTLSDEDVSQVAPAERQVSAVGAPGSGVFVDTSRCLHQGSRARTQPRLVFQFQYVSRPDALLAKVPGKVVPGGHLLITRQLIEGLSLSNPKAMLFVD